jgi:hypothetical protein
MKNGIVNATASWSAAALCRPDIADSSRKSGRGLPQSKTLRRINPLVLSVPIRVYPWLKLFTNSSGVVVAVPRFPTTIPAA